ncbi:response regulator transcription factor [Nocardiopsis halotolerans]|uniref:response regulator transcription factor n=1 Tax=Nocardiopsis halotolerans TaxID=124252 RepID=UPI0003496790|nr:response regulator transcription factor [Nocardiopsis halotolerans]
MRVLVVGAGEESTHSPAPWLRAAGFAVDTAPDGETALYKLAVNEYGVMLLERLLPGLSGDEVCRVTTMRHGQVRVLMISSRDDPKERLTGFALGADDYLARPFDHDEMIARVRALARRPGRADPPVLERSGLRLDSARYEAFRDGRLLQLSPKQFGVLEELLRADGAPVSAEVLLERVWDENIDPFTTIVRVTIRSLRRKLGDPDPIETLPRVGYRLV